MPAIMQMLLHALLCFSLLLFLPSPCTSLSKDGKLLLHIRDTYWIDKSNVMRNWNRSHENPCRWYGVNCNRFNAVTTLILQEASIAGNLTSAICGLSSLTELILSKNNFDGPFPDELLKCKNLENLDLSSNKFAGTLPDRIFQLKELKVINLAKNGFVGKIPNSFGNLTQLEVLHMSLNLLSGNIPSGLMALSKLKKLYLGHNTLSGRIPLNIGNSFANLTQLELVDMSMNLFSGNIPSGLMALSKMTELYLGDNIFSGRIPLNIGSSFGNLTQLEVLDMSMNLLSGNIPSGLMALSNLQELFLGDNTLSGRIPFNIGELRSLEALDLHGNQLNGEIPASLGNISQLSTLDLSNNLFSGRIPDELRNIGQVNLANNNLSYPNKFSFWRLGIILASLVVALLFISVCYFRNPYLFQLFSMTPPPWKLTFFHSVQLNESYILRNLTDDNLIGSGGGGNVYKVTLQNQSAVAVKKIQNIVGSAEYNTHTHQENNRVEMETEIDTLGLIRHVNILRLLCYISSEEVDFKLLVYEYMPNGSLFDCLHPVGEPEMALPWPTRYKIAVGAARALSYIHHDCFPPILHRDVKSSNILLDADFEAKLGDFDQSRLLQNLGAEYWVSAYVGSHGYIAPEYVERLKVSEKSDIYSFGVVLLELVSGKKAIDDVEFGEGVNIVGWMNRTLWKGNGTDKTEAEQQVLDRRILDKVGCNFIQEMLGVLRVGLVCTNRIPSQRPSMRDVVDMLIMCTTTPNSDEEKIPTPSALVPFSSSSTTPPSEGEI